MLLSASFVNCYMDISINTPALLFPAISLVMLAYTNRFLALSSRVRSLHDTRIMSKNISFTVRLKTFGIG